MDASTVEPVTLRLATLDDLGTLVAHRRGMWRDMGEADERALDAADLVYRRWARTRMRSGTLVGWIAEKEGAPVGSGCAWVRRLQPRPGAPDNLVPYLLSMYTEPAHRGQGVARLVVQAAMAWARGQGYARMDLHAAPMGRALYEKLGFERTWEMRATL